MQQIGIGDGVTTWLTLACRGVRAEGKLYPRLILDLEGRTTRERMDVHLQLLRGRLLVGQEVAGEGLVAGVRIGWQERGFSLEIPMSRDAIGGLGELAGGDQIMLTLAVSGVLWCKDDNSDTRQFASRPAPGEWGAEVFGESRQLTVGVQVARSDWYTRVLQNIGTLDYVSCELAIPRGDTAMRVAVSHLQEAERAWANGDHPGVFAKCKASFDALPGAPKGVFDGVRNPRERKALDELLRHAGNYLHLGRHVDRDGETASPGEFPVGAQDARFALNMTKVLLSHLGTVLSRIEA